MKIVFWIYFHGLLFLGSCLKITNLYVPKTAYHETPLSCRYDLEGGTLYDVKWYKDDHHFFQCSADGKVTEFPTEGIKIYHSNMAYPGECSFTLTGLNPKAGGVYKCEVSLDAPTFQLVSKSSILRIVDPPKKKSKSNRVDLEYSSEDYLEDTEEPKNTLSESMRSGSEGLLPSFCLLIVHVTYFMIC